jgi:photosystem II PsbY protein
VPTAAATLLAAGNAQAATELATLAAGDNRFGTIALLFLPALGWVAFNIFSPLLNQLSRMNELNADAAAPKAGGKKRRGIAGAVGLSAALSLAAASQAEAATEVAQLAASDNRFGTIALLFLPALGWVAFNIFSPLLNQLSRMNELNSDAAPKAGGKKRR